MILNQLEEIKNHINNYILKTGEQIEFSTLDPAEINRVGVLHELTIVKRTARTYRKTGMLIVAVTYDDQTPLPEGSLLAWSVGKKAQLPEDSNAFTWLAQGWIMKEYRFKHDGKTAERISYRMGPRLFQYQQQLIDNKREAEDRQWSELRQALRNELDSFKALEPAKFLEVTNTSRWLPERKENITSLISVLDVLLQHHHLDDFSSSPEFPTNWTGNKRLLFMHFTQALVHLSIHKRSFDWKEIGATYERRIGGSKIFDPYKQDFLTLIEAWSSCPLPLLGLYSLGQITSVYFTGPVSGRYSNYLAGPVHALTDLCVFKDEYSTSARTLWLVENRAILTRFAAEGDFVQSSGSLIIGVDGQLRGAHTRLIRQLLQGDSIQQVIIWSDYDESGLVIAKHLTSVVKEAGQGRVVIKWICHDHSVATCFEEYEKYMQERLIKDERMEQELILGSETDWKKWIEC
ncbi:DUF2399 domain-containing protein [Paenibacillus dokdonensis]|uniref:DUF2399 domain-containing protein n=1 Tax=Paenibacillus dokdonensis TaxID=2567944 RepID=UPI001457DCD4|nr:DUF2399 domain-containing protein [Paenibacillus dokdonensis]